MSGIPLYTLIIVIFVVVTICSAVGFTTLFKKNPKSYMWTNIIIMIYPYVYMIALYIAGKATKLSYSLEMDLSKTISNITLVVYLFLFIIYHALVLGTLIADFISAIKGYLDPKSMAISSLVVKAVQIPAYVFHFGLGILGVITNIITGFAPLFFALFIDFVTIAITGAFTTANSIGLCKRNIITKPIAVLASLLSFIYCVDVADVIVLYVLSRKKIKKLD